MESTNVLICSICFESYNLGRKKPLLLPCEHTFCASCITRFKDECPSCQREFTSSDLQKNYALCYVLEELGTNPIETPTNRPASDLHSRIMYRDASEELKDKCPKHKREIERFCTGCVQLLCSACSCEHTGKNPEMKRYIISEGALRREIGNIVRDYRDVEMHQKELLDQIDRKASQLVEEIYTAAERLKIGLFLPK